MGALWRSPEQRVWTSEREGSGQPRVGRARAPPPVVRGGGGHCTVWREGYIEVPLARAPKKEASLQEGIPNSDKNPHSPQLSWSREAHPPEERLGRNDDSTVAT